MAWLLIDNSNTRTKFALGDARGLSDWRGVIPTAEVSPVVLEKILQGIDFSAVIMCSVVPAKAVELTDFFAPHCLVHSLKYTSPLGMLVDTPYPTQIGADRLANAAGVLGRHGAPAIVIDFGTAVTFDAVSAAPAFCGGVIAPGLGVFSGYLPRKTAQLPAITFDEPASAIGKSTVLAMQSGAVFGYRGLVREIIVRIRSEMLGNVKVIATGGDAEVISPGMPEIDAVDPDITLDGLRQVAVRLFA